MKYFRIYLKKERKDLYTENYKTFLREVKEDPNKWRDIPVYGWDVFILLRCHFSLS